MARAFDITTTSPTLRLDGSRQGEVAFTVTNALGQPVRGRAVVVPEGSASPEWFSLVDEAEREFPQDGTHVFHVKLAIPASQPAGEHAFHLLVVDQSNPDERFADGPSVAFRVPAPVVAARRRFPWWIPVSAAAALLLLVLVGVLARGGRDEGTGGSGPPVTEPPPETPASSVLVLDGTSTYVDLGQPLSLEVTGPLTLEAWVRPTTPSGVMNIISRGYVVNPSGEIYLRILHGNYQAGSYVDGKGFGGVSAQMPAQDVNEWVYLTAVFDGEKWRLFRNGELLVESPHPGGGGFPMNARWAIGARGGGGERFFNGNIRDVRIWEVARTQQQIRHDMNNPPAENEEGLLGFWPLGEGSGSRALDRSGNEAHGFIHKGKWGTP